MPSRSEELTLRVVQLGCWSFWPYSDLLLQLVYPAVGTVLNVQSNKFIGLKDAHVKPSNKGLKPDRLDFD